MGRSARRGWKGGSSLVRALRRGALLLSEVAWTEAAITPCTVTDVIEQIVPEYCRLGTHQVRSLTVTQNRSSLRGKIRLLSSRLEVRAH